jgi:TonB family protein
MTAAAVRPDLFSHLFATKQERHSTSDVAATLMSLAFHVGIVAALICASSQIKAADTTIVRDQMPIILVDPEQPSPSSSDHPSGGGSRSAESFAVVPQFPADIPVGIANLPTDEPWFNPEGQQVPGISGSPGVDAGPDSAPTKDGFAIVQQMPQLLNADEVTRALVRNYPPILRDAGIGGAVVVWLLIDESGRVVKTEVQESSGQSALDRAALEVGELMRFSPASNRGQAVKVWVAVPVRFTTK